MTDRTETVFELLRRLCDEHPEAGPDELATLAYPLCDDDMILALLRREAGHIRRSRTRAIERAAFLNGHWNDDNDDQTGDGGDVEWMPPATARKALLDETFYTLEFGYVRWGSATVEQHQARIDYQLQLRHGIDVDIRRHEEAIGRIEEANVTCLDEIDGAAA